MRFSSSELSSHLLAFSVSFIAKNWRKYPYGSKRVKTSVLNFLAKICGAILQLLGRENSPGEKKNFFSKLTRILVSKNSGWVVSKSENTVWLFNCCQKKKSPGSGRRSMETKIFRQLNDFFITTKWNMTGEVYW